MSKTLKWSAGDIYFDNNGKTKEITDDEKIAQDLAYFILGESKLFNNRELRFRDIAPIINSAVIKLKNEQSKKNNITNRERIAGIEELLVVPDPDEPKTSAYFFLRVSTESGDIYPFLFDAKTFTDLSHLLP